MSVSVSSSPDTLSRNRVLEADLNLPARRNGKLLKGLKYSVRLGKGLQDSLQGESLTWPRLSARAQKALTVLHATKYPERT